MFRKKFFYVMMILMVVGYLKSSPPSFTPQSIGNLEYAKDVIARDVDGDGDYDFIVSGYDSVVVFRNDDGTFTKIFVGAVFRPYDVSAGDFDGDGDLDIVATSSDTLTPYVYLYINNNWSFTETQVGYCKGATGVNVGDIDNDGDLDIVATAYKLDSLLWFENTGGGFIRHNIDGKVYDGWEVELFDIDGNDYLDVAVASGTWYKPLLVFFNQDGGTTWNRDSIVSLYPRKPYQPVGVDIFDENLIAVGITDTTDTIPNIVVYYRDGGTWDTVCLYPSYDGVRKIALEDFDLDGDVDIVAVTKYPECKALYFENLSNYNFASPVEIGSASNGFYGLYSFDYDNDGDMDFVVGSGYFDSGEVTLYINQTANIDETYVKKTNPKIKILYMPNYVVLEGVYNIKLFNLNGRLIKQGKKLKISKSGVYIYKIGSSSGKIIFVK